MMRIRKVLILLALLSTVFIMPSCGRKTVEKPKEAAKASVPGTTADDAVKHKVLAFNLEGLSDKGAKKWDVKGESAEAISENEIRLDNIVAKAYGEEAEAVITADQGVYDRAKNNVRLEKNVKATIEATQGFTGNFVDGSDQKGGKAAQGPKKGAAKEKQKTIITCDGEVQFDYEKNQAFFLKNVKVSSEDGSINADKITVYLDPDSRRLKEIVAEGSVKITRGENITYSDKATYVEADKKIVLSGKPKLVFFQEGGMGFDTGFISEARK